LGFLVDDVMGWGMFCVYFDDVIVNPIESI